MANSMIYKVIFALLWALSSALSSPAQAADEFLAPEQAYRYTTRVAGDQLIVQWTIEPGYYLYKKKMGLASTMGSVQLGEPAWPKGLAHSDEYFGEQEIYRGTVTVPVPLIQHGPQLPPTLALELKLQGCADAGLCYPPQKWRTEVALPAKLTKTSASNALAADPGPGTPANQPVTPAGQSNSGAPAAKGNDLRSFLGSAKAGQTGPGWSSGDEFLPPDQAFKFGAGMERADSVALTWIIADGYYLYKQQVAVTSRTPGVRVGQPVLPQGQPKHDEYFGDTEVFYQFLEGSLPVARAAGTSGPLTLEVTYQGCADGGLCYNPITKTITVDMPLAQAAIELPAPPPGAAGAGNAGAADIPGAAPVAEQDRLAAVIRDGNLGAVLATFFGLGLLLAFTPCVLPMLPILSGIIAGQGTRLTPARGFALAFTYVQGMALTYATAGAAFVLAFNQAPQAFFQQPWIVALFVLLFVALALAMFGVYNLQLPSSLQTRLSEISNRQKSGSYVGVFVMGALSALIVTACVAPAVIAALSVISQSGQVARGAAALYATGLGMGVPLLIVGASAGSLLPRVGPWMETIKQLFGVLFLAVAIYLLGPLIPGAMSMLLWSMLAAIAGYWVFSLKGRDGGPAAAPVRALGLLTLVYGILLLIGLAAGGRDPLEPLRPLTAGTGLSLGPAARDPLPFQHIKTVADLQQQVAAATAAGRPVMLDFYADWCVSCKEMEKYTFTDPAVRAVLAGATLLQADVTANDEADRALLAHFGIFGPPTIAFFGRDGVERRNFRLVGFVPAEQFRGHVTAAFAAP